MQVEPGVRCQPGPARRCVCESRSCQDHMHGLTFRDPVDRGADDLVCGLKLAFLRPMVRELWVAEHG